MSKTVKRFDLHGIYDRDMQPDTDGDYVLFSDYQELQAKLQKATIGLSLIEKNDVVKEGHLNSKEIASETLAELKKGESK